MTSGAVTRRTLLGGAGAGALLLATAARAHAALGPAIFYSPHQDDETLSMGCDVSNHVRAGREVHVVLVTDGAASGARAEMAAAGISLSVPEFVAARTAEFTAALNALGVPTAHIHSEGYSDGQLTIGQATKVMAKWADTYPGASHKTMSWADGHPDHVACGAALRNLHRAGAIPDARFYQSRLYWTSKPVPGWYPRGDINPAIAAYKVKDPGIGRYAIGPDWSVPGQFAADGADQRDKVHLP